MARQLFWSRLTFLPALMLMLAASASAFTADPPQHHVERGRHQVVGEIDVYYGVLPAQVAGKHPPAHEERAMHDGVPVGKNDYHLIVALFGKGGARITDAQVWATVAELGLTGPRRKLEPMRIENSPSFGNYFTLHGEGPYRIAIEVQLPGATKPVEALFEYRLP